MYVHGVPQVGNHSVLGATPVKDEKGNILGVNFAVHAGIPATKVVLCLLTKVNPADPSTWIEQQIEIEPSFKNDENIWSCYIPGLGVDTLYNYRVHGPWNPKEGHIFNHHKVLLDPYARDGDGNIQWGQGENKGQEVHGYTFGNPYEMNTLDSAKFMRWGKVIDWPKEIEEAWQWREDHGVPLGSTVHPKDRVIMEFHIAGGTKGNSNIPLQLRGTYESLCHPSVIKFLKESGATSVEIMPIHSYPEKGPMGDNDINFWGYNSICFLTYNSKGRPNPSKRFTKMVQYLREHGIEVIMDVVFNHTAEGSELGATLCQKGFDSRQYHRSPHVEHGLLYFSNYSGCGNTLDVSHIMVQRLIMESLRDAILRGVAGVRYDLGTVLGMDKHGNYNSSSEMFTMIQNDPVLNGTAKFEDIRQDLVLHEDRVQLRRDCPKEKFSTPLRRLGKKENSRRTAKPEAPTYGAHQSGEPWHIGGMHLTDVPFAAWNGPFRDALIKLLLSKEEGTIGELSQYLTGSPRKQNGKPSDFINYITAHDGFTLADLTAALIKGMTPEELKSHPDISQLIADFKEEIKTNPETLRIFVERQKLAICQLVMAVGTPFLPHGHGHGWSQKGNGNAYNMDDDTTTVNWALEPWQKELQEFTQEMLSLKARRPELRREDYYSEKPDERGKKDITFYDIWGNEMKPGAEDWGGKAYCYVIRGEKISENENGPIYNPDIITFVNLSQLEDITFTLPKTFDGKAVQVLNTTLPSSNTPATIYETGPEKTITIRPHATVILESGSERSVDLERKAAISPDLIVEQRLKRPTEVS